METPVLFIIFNRPDTTVRVWEAIRAARPKRLYVAGDGPRNPTEAEFCRQTRAVIETIDWPCELQTFFREQNVGCKIGVSGAIDWFFSNEEEGIILEDDCLPHPSFFEYCETVLARYRNDPRVMHVGGNNWQDGHKRGDASYYFSRYPHIWGWATWRRAWRLFDINMAAFPQIERENYLNELFPTLKIRNYWQKKFRQCYEGTMKTAWSYQWLFATLLQNGLSITPNVNLVSNVGFGTPGAANTGALSRRHPMANVPTNSILPLTHPAFLIPHATADVYTFRKIFSPNYFIKAKNKFYELIEK